jgi:ABC-type nickel/cobalt efflux system permease component RcnA
LIAVVEDASKPAEERSGALVGLASTSRYKGLKQAILAFYLSFPGERVRVIKAMWRTLDKTWAKYISEALSSTDDDVREQGILGVGNLAIGSEVDKLEALFDHDRLRPAALYAYGLAAPGQTTRANMKPMFSLIEKIADGLDEEETELVEAALDERLAVRGLKPVFHVEDAGHGHDHHDHHHHDHDDHEHHHHSPVPAATAAPSAMPKVGRNDPCPCGSGKKYKKCHGQ